MLEICMAYFTLTMANGSKLEVVGNDTTNYNHCMRISRSEIREMKRDILRDKSIIFKDVEFNGCKCSGSVGHKKNRSK